MSIPSQEELQSLVEEHPTKYCRECNEWKDLGDFWKRRNAPDGLQPYCKPCQQRKVDSSKAKRAAGQTPQGKQDTPMERTGNCVICDGQVTNRHKSYIVKDELICGACNTYYWTALERDPQLYFKAFQLFMRDA